MFKRILIRPYSSECGGARDIVKVLQEQGIESKRVYSDASKFLPEEGDFFINWGASYPPDWAYAIPKKSPFLNHWNAVANSVSKIRSFQNFKKEGVPTPGWTTSLNQAEIWSQTGWVVCRQKDNGYDGAGLVLARKPSELVRASLYTQYIEAEEEFRVYIFKEELLDLLYKYPTDKVTSPIIRTETNGWEYGRSAWKVSKNKIEIAVKAIKANGMDFGGVDVIKDKKGNLFVLETNSEPGIGKITAQKFANFIRKEAGL